MEQTGRKQFTCYRSYYEAIRKIKKAADRAKAYDILMEYALNGVEPEEEALSVPVSIAFLLMKPTLDTGRQKAENGRKGGSKPQANAKQTASKKEVEVEKEVEIEIEKELEKESYNPLTPFARFWQAYPRKEGRREAERVFAGVNESVDILLRAIEEQRQQPGWCRENGRYIPGPARWLSEKRWQNTVSVQPNVPGDLELQAIRKIMTDPNYLAPRSPGEGPTKPPGSAGTRTA